MEIAMIAKDSLRLGLALPKPVFTPPDLRLPANTLSIFWRRAASSDSIRACAPFPTATLATKVGITMMMPWVVRVDLILLRRNVRSAMRVVKAGRSRNLQKYRKRTMVQEERVNQKVRLDMVRAPFSSRARKKLLR